MTYDLLGRKTAMDDPDMGVWDYGYDALGNLVRQDDAREQRICFYYDALNRLQGKAYGDDATECPSSPTYAVSYGYDLGSFGKGRRTSMTDTSGSSGWSYDGRGRVIWHTKTVGSYGPFDTSWSYDAADRAVSLTYPDGEQVATSYNPQGLPETLKKQPSTFYVTAADYNALGQVELLSLGNTLRTAYTYEADSFRLWKLKTGTQGNPTLRQYLEYQYDDAGNVHYIHDFKKTEELTFQYDSLDRLLGASGAYAGEYEYTLTGNLTSKTEGATSAAMDYDDADHVHAKRAERPAVPR
jgi:YD repeat-containing protein